ncbi:MAG: hypothetical protein C0501_30195 [Isosphaera sp.]|nr:hypothetical protein [Isosphaera sp.]
MIKVETRKSAEVARLSELWDRSGVEFSKGYLAGIFDAEGSFGKSGGSRPCSLRISNTDAAYLAGVLAHASVLGFRFKVENFHGRHCKTARLYGSLDEIGRFFGEVRPALSYKRQAAFGCRIEGRTPRVVAVEYVGERDLIDIQTSSRTFVANGYLTHNCYAETMSKRLRLMGQRNYRNGFALTLHEHMLDVPLRWKKPRKIFVNSMSDLYHRDVPDDFVRRVFDTMTRADWHQYQVLTKRADRLEELAPSLPWGPHIWQGVSVESADYAFRIDHLRRTPARVKFLSVEPLLGPVPDLDLAGIHWVIVGGESGGGCRPMELEWVAGLRAACDRQGIPLFVKQTGERLARRLKLTSKKGGDPAEWPAELRVRQFPLPVVS